jgi:hypothetical protein
MDIIWGCLDAGVVRVLRVKIQRFWDTSSINLCGHFIGLRKSLAFPFSKSFINYPPTTESLFCFLQEKKKKKEERKIAGVCILEKPGRKRLVHYR